MAEHIEIPSGALLGNWIADQEPVEPSGSAAFCMESLSKLINGDDVWLHNPERKRSVLDSRPQNSASIFVATGGTSGRCRFARHTWGTMSAAVFGLQGVLGGAPIDSWCCLPIWHIAGWMQVVRAIQTNGDVVFGDYRDLANPQKDINLTGRLISLVPTQLHRLISSDLAVCRLRGSRLILLGGAPLVEELAEVVRSVGLPVAPTYGMTESAGAVTLLASDRFLAGENSVGKVLPHTNLRLDEETGTLSIRAKSMCLGYESLDFSSGEWFETSDLAEQTYATFLSDIIGEFMFLILCFLVYGIHVQEHGLLPMQSKFLLLHLQLLQIGLPELGDPKVLSIWAIPLLGVD